MLLNYNEMQIKMRKFAISIIIKYIYINELVYLYWNAVLTQNGYDIIVFINNIYDKSLQCKN